MPMWINRYSLIMLIVINFGKILYIGSLMLRHYELFYMAQKTRNIF